ncbi:MAG TPA: PASTA domain-containing protein [Gemmatimonadota bacterium]|nr:PASTA domain-containing protein [Gemmatimonadota bacterium]
MIAGGGQGPEEGGRSFGARRAIVRRKRSAAWQIGIALILATIGAVGLGYLAVQLFHLPETLAQSEAARVPDLTDRRIGDARSLGESQGYVVIETDHHYSDDVEDGRVIYQVPPPGFYLPRGDTVRVLISRGPVRTTVPDVAGLDHEMARSILHQLGLETTPPRREPSELQPYDAVIETVPPIGTAVEPGSRITFVLSRGGSILAMPDIRGLALTAARDTLEIYSLTVGEVTTLEGQPVSGEGRVVVSGQDPAPGRNVRAGSAVRVHLGEDTP